MNTNDLESLPDEDGLFATSLNAMDPAGARLSVATTFYRAGFAAGSATTTPVSLSDVNRTRRIVWRVAGASALGLMFGLLGFLWGTSQQNVTDIPLSASIANEDLPLSVATFEEDSLGQAGSESSVASVTESLAIVLGADPLLAGDDRHSLVAWLLPRQRQRLSLGSLGQRNVDLVRDATMHHRTDERPAITSKPMKSIEMMNVLIAY